MGVGSLCRLVVCERDRALLALDSNNVDMYLRCKDVLLCGSREGKKDNNTTY